MELESIRKIVEAEKEAENKKEEAKQKAKVIIEKAENSKEINRVYFKGQLERREKELRKEKAEENTKKISKIQAETNEKLQKLKAVLNENVPEAVEKIYNKVIKI
ncbi:MAG: hypothetical protein HFH67_17570 [Lachnospiraceae bacterium]|nr:hypothetical protein [Lachnospiraceae bacterium]